MAIALALTGLSGLTVVAPAAPAQAAGTYTNPLPVKTNTGHTVETCADPTVLRGARAVDRPSGSASSVRYWYMYCTADPLRDEDRTASGFNFRPIPQFRSTDLVNWRYVGDAFSSGNSSARPAYIAPSAGLWAPEVDYIAGKYRMYYTVTETLRPCPTNENPNQTCGNGPAIGVATSDGPTGPWTHKTTPVVEPHGAQCCGPDSRRHVFDPEVFRAADGQLYIMYGSYFGGIAGRRLSSDGMTSDPATQQQVAIANKFEGAEVVRRGSFYYLLLSATDCCRGAMTGYSVYVGRSAAPLGPYLDRDGRDLNDNEGPGFENDADDPTTGRAGGTTFLSFDGDKWVGPGHNTVFTDFDGQWWTIYHAINRFEPFFEGGVDHHPGNCSAEGRPDDHEGPAPQTEGPPDGRDDRTGEPCGDLNKRPAMMDPIYWDSDGWPTVRAGQWVSDETEPQSRPAAQPGQTSDYVPFSPWRSRPNGLIAAKSDEFSGSTLASRWSWIRPPSDTATYGVSGGTFRFQTQDKDLFVNSNNASVLVEDAPAGDYIVETRVRLDVPPEGCCPNYRQAGLVIYGNDDNFLKLVHASIWNTRQTEWAKELRPVPQDWPRYGNTVVGPPDEWTYFRIIRTKNNDVGTEYYQAYTSIDGQRWTRGGTWTHRLDPLAGNVKIGLVSMGGSGSTANFDYVRVYSLDIREPIRCSTSPGDCRIQRVW